MHIIGEIVRKKHFIRPFLFKLPKRSSWQSPKLPLGGGVILLLCFLNERLVCPCTLGGLKRGREKIDARFDGVGACVTA